MVLPSNLSSRSEFFLKELSFSLTESDDSGMCKYYEWANESMKFLLVDDRDYVECEILPYQKPINRINLIRLLRFLKNDVDFYKEELIKANLSFTLTTNDYIELFYNNYNLIKDFIINFSDEKYDNYDKFEYRFEE
jgi:hypothetical protein